MDEQDQGQVIKRQGGTGSRTKIRMLKDNDEQAQGRGIGCYGTGKTGSRMRTRILNDKEEQDEGRGLDVKEQGQTGSRTRTWVLTTSIEKHTDERYQLRTRTVKENGQVQN